MKKCLTCAYSRLPLAKFWNPRGPADLNNNAVCYKQLHSMLDGTAVKFKCREALYGSWVSLIKTDTVDNSAYLQLKEVRVYACE